MTYEHEASVKRIAEAISAHIKLLFDELKQEIELPDHVSKDFTLEQFQQQIKDLYADKSPIAQGQIVKYIGAKGGIGNIPVAEYDKTIREIKGFINEQ